MSKNQVTPPNPEKNKKLSKRTKIFVVIGLLCVPLIIFGLGSIDASPDDYSALTPIKRTPPADQENVMFYMNQITDLSDLGPTWHSKLYNLDGSPEDSPYHHKHQWDQAYWDQVLEDNKKDLAHLNNACNAPCFYNQPEDDPLTPETDVLSLISKNRLYLLNVLNLIHNQKWEEAIIAIKLQKKHSTILINDSQSLIDLLVAVAVDHYSGKVINLLLESEATPKKIIQDCISVLKTQRTSILKPKLTEAFKQDFNNLNTLLNATYAKDQYLPYSFHKNRAMNKYAKLIVQFLNYEKLNAPQINQHLSELKNNLGYSDKPWRAFLPNAEGDKTLTSTAFVVGRQAIGIYASQIYNELFLLKAAARLHQQEHGELPDKIEDLHTYIGGPIYDPMQPPLTPYQYSKANGRAWSIGDDFIDDGGSEDSIITNQVTQGTDYAIDLFYPKTP